MDTIRIRGARTHNLQDLDLELPRNRLIVVTGLSGSGKSSLAFDTIYAEGQRRYVESLSAYARQFLSMMEKPDVDHIEGLSPAISIEQKATSHNPRSTVGTITEIHDYLRLLYARVGTPRCPTHGTRLDAQTVSQMVDQVLGLPEGTRLMLLAPVVDGRKGEHYQLLSGLRAQGFVRARIDGEVIELDTIPELELHKQHTIEVVVDRFRVRGDLALRLAESFETALRLADGVARVTGLDDDGPELLFSARFACPQCGYSVGELEPRLFSFNNPHGACPACDGLGVRQFFDPDRVVAHPEASLAAGAVRGWDRRNAYYFALISALASHYGFDLETPWRELPEPTREALLFGSQDEQIEFRYLGERGRAVTRRHPFEGIVPNMERRYRETDSNVVREELARYLNHRPCPDCGGTRLGVAARHVEVADMTLPSVAALSIRDAHSHFDTLELEGHRATIADKIVAEIGERLRFLVNVGLDYLTLERSAETLSGGEAQRIRLASQIGAGLVGVMYVLDEPSIGLHQRDNRRLIDTLTRLRDLGNTVLVVEHDEETIRESDWIVDIGPGAGEHGGQVVYSGPVAGLDAVADSVTGDYLSGRRSIPVPGERRPPKAERLVVRGAREHNLDDLTVEIPLGCFVAVTGVSGSGKSTLVRDILLPVLMQRIYKSKTPAGRHKRIDGIEHLDKVIDMDQSPIGRTPRSNPATYTGVFDHIRKLFATTNEAKVRGYLPGRFSFNVKGGRCEACSGDGTIKIEMHFLPDVYVPCEVCKGARYNRDTLDIEFKGRNIADVLDMPIAEAVEFFSNQPPIARHLQTLMDVGLGYVRLGQSAPTLSGGEAQRVKLATELAKRSTGHTIYLLDEPTTGLHFEDVRRLLTVLSRLVDQGNTVLVIEHNLDVIKTADWLIDLGPEGGVGGGRLVAEGTPEAVASVDASHTGRYLRQLLA